ncbi:MAG: YIP1 family protein [Salinirussus sp.]
MTQWSEGTGLGRQRGPVGLVRAWGGILARPRTFFREQVAPGDQAPGLTFAAVVVLATELIRISLVADAYPVVAGRPAASAVLWVLFVVVLVAPAGIHLTAALQTVILMGTVPDRAGVSETVQVLCYAMAPCVLIGIPDPWVRAAAALWGAGLAVVGVAEVHNVHPGTALVVAAIPAFLIFGYGFGGYEATVTVWETVARVAGLPAPLLFPGTG